MAGCGRPGSAGYLRDRYNMALNGIVMISPAFNFDTIDFAFGQRFAVHPVRAGLHGDGLVSQGAAGRFAGAVARRRLQAGSRVRERRLHAGDDEGQLAERRGAERGGRETGAATRACRRNTSKIAKLRITMQRFAKELLRDRSRTVGRYDSRYKGIDADDAGENSEYDASAGDRVRPLHGGDQRLSAQRSEVRGRPRVRDPHRQGAAVELRATSAIRRRMRRTRCGSRCRQIRS